MGRIAWEKLYWHLRNNSSYHMSRDVEYSVLPRRTSGGRYHNVTTSCEYVWHGTDFARASPVRNTSTVDTLATKKEHRCYFSKKNTQMLTDTQQNDSFARENLQHTQLCYQYRNYCFKHHFSVKWLHPCLVRGDLQIYLDWLIDWHASWEARNN